MKANKLNKLKKLIKEEIKKLQEQPLPSWNNNTGYYLASTYMNSIGGVCDGVFVLPPSQLAIMKSLPPFAQGVIGVLNLWY